MRTKEQTREYNRRYHAKNREKHVAYSRRYNAEHRAALNAGCRAWHHANKERVKAYRQRRKAHRNALLKQKRILAKTDKVAELSSWVSRQLVVKQAQGKRYYAAHRDEILEKNRANYRANSDKVYARTHQWQQENPIKTRQHRETRKARRMGVARGDPALITAWERRWKARKTVRCYWCKQSFSPKRCHTDHVVALSIGGSHSIENLAISCAKCNQRKEAASVAEWNKRIMEPVLL